MIEAVLKAMVDGHNGYAESLGIKPAIEAIRNEAERNGFREIQSIFVGYRQRRSHRQLPDRAAQSRRQRADAEP